MDFLVGYVLQVGLPVTFFVSVLPWQFLLRLMALLGLLFAWEWSFRPPVHWSDEGVFYVIFIVLYYLTCALGLAVFAARAAIRAFREKPVAPVAWWGDWLLSAGLGALLACIAFIGLSWITQASDAPLFVHGAVLAVALGLGWVAWEGVGRAYFVNSAIVLASLTLWSGLIYPDRVLRAADLAAEEHAYCIALQARERAATRSDLTFLTMDKQTYPRHAILVIAGMEASKAPHWSFHRGGFLERGGPLSSWRCNPDLQ
ncbi:MAG: hypothetical protein HKN27_00980 [Silicimonas sp.]|nr:hypothetical protein [Silicimonas sp.]